MTRCFVSYFKMRERRNPECTRTMMCHCRAFAGYPVSRPTINGLCMQAQDFYQVQDDKLKDIASTWWALLRNEWGKVREKLQGAVNLNVDSVRVKRDRVRHSLLRWATRCLETTRGRHHEDS